MYVYFVLNTAMTSIETGLHFGDLSQRMLSSEVLLELDTDKRQTAKEMKHKVKFF